MTRLVFFSHDGFGLGHVRRNARIARAVRRHDPTAEITVVTGTTMQPRWLTDRAFAVVRIAPLIKDAAGVYRHPAMGFEAALAERAAAFRSVVTQTRPHVVLVDRHPYGIGGELRGGLDLAQRLGAHLVLGLRDVIDEPPEVKSELAGAGWHDVSARFTQTLVYGERRLCDFEVEYGLPMKPRYCGLVGPDPKAPRPRRPRELVIAAGGGGDGRSTFDLAAGLLGERPDWRATALVGPYADNWSPSDPTVNGRITSRRNVRSCSKYFATSAAVLAMAGYNSTVEALTAGIRPILVPRRSPRREQAIRASRLAAMGLADVIDVGADAAEAAWLLDRPRTIEPGACAAAGLRLDGADRVARRLLSLCELTTATRTGSSI